MYKYQGAGNDFVVIDNRDGSVALDAAAIARICDRRYGIGADGLMLLERAEGYDFGMVYYNSDGSGGMMCGNGGRCIVAFAAYCGITGFHFIAADGEHDAEILSRRGNTMIVSLGMKDVDEIVAYPDLGGVFLDTGTRHLVCPVSGIDDVDVVGVGRPLRYRPDFAPVGVNVNFTEMRGNTLFVRTYEKGVEDETYACGTGITASAIAAWHALHPEGSFDAKPVHIDIRALRDRLAVEFVPVAGGARDVCLIGPATLVARIDWLL